MNFKQLSALYGDWNKYPMWFWPAVDAKDQIATYSPWSDEQESVFASRIGGIHERADKAEAISDGRRLMRLIGCF